MTEVIHCSVPAESKPMTPKQYLSRARTLDGEINSKLEQIARLKAQLTRCTQAFSGTPGGGPHDWTDTVARIVGLEAEINADINRLIDLKQEIKAAIEAVDNPTYRQLLELRYLCGMSWQRIADEMHYDRKSVWRIHGRALNAIELPESCHTMPHSPVL